MHPIKYNHRYAIDHLKEEGTGGELAKLSRVELEENKRPKILAFFNWRISNKKKEMQICIVVRDVIVKRTESFVSKRIKQVIIFI